MSLLLPRLYAITDKHVCALSHAEQVGKLIRGGATLIQLREKHLPSGQFYQEAEAAVRVARANGVKVIINDRVDIALALHADGVHLGQHDLSSVVARKLLGPDAIIGVSIHNKEQAIDALALPIDYLGVGPIFATNSKQNPDPTLGLDGLLEIRRITADLPLVAIGGITLKRAAGVFNAGADGIALISALLASPVEIEANTRSFLSATVPNSRQS